MGRKLVIDNPFLMMTKAEVAGVFTDCGRKDLVGASVSCTHTMFMTKAQAHCGVCSQCIDRRMVILAAGLGDSDPATDYEIDVFTGGRDDRLKCNLAVDYVAHAVELHQARPEEIAARYNTELVRAARPLGDVTAAVESLVAVHKRHAEAVCRVVTTQLQQCAKEALLSGLDQTSLLGLVQLNKHKEPPWERLCGRIVDVLRSGLPDACKTHKPENEPHLQEICNGLLNSNEVKLQREFPFLRWAVVMTKPDWSASDVDLLVELKYVRRKVDVRPITRDIAEDIVKYGKNDHRVLFIVYDPHHIVTAEADFAHDVETHQSMILRFVR
jgi:hypothetical protein